MYSGPGHCAQPQLGIQILISQFGRNIVSVASLTSFMKRLIHFTYEGSNMRGVLHFIQKRDKEMQEKKAMKGSNLSVSLYVTVSL